MPRPLRRLIREFQRQREEFQRQREEVSRLTSQVVAQGEELRKYRNYGRRRWFILQLPASLVVALFGGWLDRLACEMDARRWVQSAPNGKTSAFSAGHTTASMLEPQPGDSIFRPSRLTG